MVLGQKGRQALVRQELPVDLMYLNIVAQRQLLLHRTCFAECATSLRTQHTAAVALDIAMVLWPDIPCMQLAMHLMSVLI